MRRLIPAVAALAFVGTAAPAPGPHSLDDDRHLHQTVAGDTLIGLARRYLDDPTAWREIARINGVARPRRLPVGVVLQIPLRLMRSDPLPAELLNVAGPVRGADGGALRQGQGLPAGSSLATGDEGGASIRLVDGTLLRLRGGSRLRLSESRRIDATGLARAAVRLDEGRIEVRTRTESGGRPGFRIETPQGVLGVRGTEFRVSVEPRAQVTRTEVTRGRVSVAGFAVVDPLEVAAGQGAAIDATGRPGAAVALPEAPDLQALPTLQEETVVRFVMPVLQAGERWRLQLADEAEFAQLLRDQIQVGPQLRIEGLADGDYRLRLRRVTADGFEGLDGIHAFRLKARPEAPLPYRPAPHSELRATGVVLEWATQPQAREYRVQLAGAAGFAEPLLDRRVRGETRLAIDVLAPGAYRWRVASVADGDDQGPFGAVSAFSLKPPPPLPPAVPAPRLSAERLEFAWAGAPGQQFDVQLARDATFSPLLFDKRVSTPAVQLPWPGSGRFHVRLRAIDPDGFVGPFSAPQHFDLPHCVRAASAGCVEAAGQPLLSLP